jgi:hypothetical protein
MTAEGKVSLQVSRVSVHMLKIVQLYVSKINFILCHLHAHNVPLLSMGSSIWKVPLLSMGSSIWKVPLLSMGLECDFVEYGKYHLECAFVEYGK